MAEARALPAGTATRALSAPLPARVGALERLARLVAIEQHETARPSEKRCRSFVSPADFCFVCGKRVVLLINTRNFRLRFFLSLSVLGRR